MKNYVQHFFPNQTLIQEFQMKTEILYFLSVLIIIIIIYFLKGKYIYSAFIYKKYDDFTVYKSENSITMCTSG